MQNTLYHISEDLKALEALLYEAGGEIENPEAELAIDSWLKELGAARDIKIDNYCRLIREIEARNASRRAEAERLKALAVQDTVAVNRLMSRLKFFLEEHELKRLSTPAFRLTLRTNGGQRPLRFIGAPTPVELPEEYRKVTVEADKQAIREALEAGQELPFAYLEARGTHLRID